MDVELPSEVSVDATASASNDQLLTELGELLEQTAAQPQNLRLLRHQVDLMLRLGMIDEAVDAAESLQSKAFVGEGMFEACAAR